MSVTVKPYKHRELAAENRTNGKKQLKPRIKESTLEAKKKKEAKLKKLEEYSDPKKQVLTPKPEDRLKFLSSWHFSVLLAGVVILILGLLALISISQSRNQLGLEVVRLTKEQDSLKEVNSRLKAKIEELVVLEDLEVIAKESLNLQTPQKGQIFVLD
jgi:hypothetical protein